MAKQNGACIVNYFAGHFKRSASALPNPTPTTTRPQSRVIFSGAQAMMRDPTVKSMLARMITRRRPIQSGEK